MYKKVKTDNPGISDNKAYEIIAKMVGLEAHSVYLRFYNQRKTTSQKVEKPTQKVNTQKNIRPEIFVGNKTGFKYKATGKGLIIQQNANDKVSVIQVLSIEDFIKELQDCKEIF